MYYHSRSTVHHPHGDVITACTSHLHSPAEDCLNRCCFMCAKQPLAWICAGFTCATSQHMEERQTPHHIHPVHIQTSPTAITKQVPVLSDYQIPVQKSCSPHTNKTSATSPHSSRRHMPPSELPPYVQRSTKPPHADNRYCLTPYLAALPGVSWWVVHVGSSKVPVGLPGDVPPGSSQQE